MRRRLPPLNAVRAFEAAARHLSFTQAADELAVTQGAISRQVRLLEDHLRLPLFRRLHRGLALTEEGRRLMTVSADLFDRLERVTTQLASAGNELRLKVPPTFAIRWLIRRLDGFERAHPHLQLRMTTAWHMADFETEDFDCAILYGQRDNPALHYDLLMDEQLSAVISPRLLQSEARAGRPLTTPADLRRMRLLHPTPDMEDWRAWLGKAGLGSPEEFRSQVFDTEDLAIQAAAGGQGVAVANPALMEDDLNAGRLVVLFPEILANRGNAYWLACPRAAAEKPKIAAFRAWVTGEARRTP